MEKPSPFARHLARRTRNEARSFALRMWTGLSALCLAAGRVLMLLRARLLTHMLAIQMLLARVGNVSGSLSLVIEELTVGASGTAALATARHQLCTAGQTTIVFCVLRTRHDCLVFAIGELFYHLLVATNALQHIHSIAAVILSASRNRKGVGRAHHETEALMCPHGS